MDARAAPAASSLAGQADPAPEELPETDDDLVIGAQRGLRGAMELVERAAPVSVPVLVLGETGSGKEVIARAIHRRSARSGGPLVTVNCGAIPPELIDSELFGHERGSFTGAVAERKGWFERAHGGTLFLDEVGELPPAAQVRLLRVVQDGTFERVGGQRTASVDVRIVAATHRDLSAMVASGRFRRDLWYRLGVFPIAIPPLRERGDDVELLARHVAARAGERLRGAPLVPSREDLALLRTQPWPGNVRELIAVIERAVLLGDGGLDVRGALALSRSAADGTRSPPPRPTAASPIRRLDEVVIEHVERALAAAAGRIEGNRGAARLLGVNPHTLRSRMRKLGIDWKRFRP